MNRLLKKIALFSAFLLPIQPIFGMEGLGRFVTKTKETVGQLKDQLFEENKAPESKPSKEEKAPKPASKPEDLKSPKIEEKRKVPFFGIDWDRAGTSLGDGFSGIFKDAIPEMTAKMTDEFSKGLTEATNKLFEDLNKNMDDNSNGAEAMKKFTDNFFKSFENNFANGGHGNQAVSNFFETFANQFDNNGQGNKAFNQFFDSVGALFKEQGAADNSVNEAMGLLRRQIAPDGNLDKTVGESFDFVERQIKQQTQQGGNLDKATDEVLGAFDRQAKKTQKRLAEGGAANNVVKEATDLAERNFNNLWDGIVHRNIILTSGLIISAIALSVTAFYGKKLLWRWIETELFKPKLLISYDAKPLHAELRRLFKPDPIIQTIFPPAVEAQINNIISATRNIHAKILAGNTNVFFGNILLEGLPGTGKTLVAQRIARESGLAWAHLSGSSFSKFKDGEGIQELDNLMKWAKQQKGLLIFIDEAESLIAKRENMDPNSKAYQLLTNFLNYTGEPSNHFMLVMATNHKNVIDSAMHRRIHDFVHIPLPEHEERAQVLELYRDKILLDAKQNNKTFVASAKQWLTDKKLVAIATATKTLSNSELANIINMIKRDADITDSGEVSSEIVDRAVQQEINKHTTLMQAAPAA